MVAVDGVGLENVVTVNDEEVQDFVQWVGVERGVVIGADGDEVNVGCWGSLAVSTAHKELGKDELSVHAKVEAASSSSTSESSSSH